MGEQLFHKRNNKNKYNYCNTSSIINYPFIKFYCISNIIITQTNMLSGLKFYKE